MHQPERYLDKNPENMIFKLLKSLYIVKTISKMIEFGKRLFAESSQISLNASSKDDPFIALCMDLRMEKSIALDYCFIRWWHSVSHKRCWYARGKEGGTVIDVSVYVLK